MNSCSFNSSITYWIAVGTPFGFGDRTHQKPIWKVQKVQKVELKTNTFTTNLDCTVVFFFSFFSFFLFSLRWGSRTPNSQFVLTCLMFWVVWIQSNTPPGELHLEVASATCHYSFHRRQGMCKLCGPAKVRCVHWASHFTTLSITFFIG